MQQHYEKVTVGTETIWNNKDNIKNLILKIKAEPDTFVAYGSRPWLKSFQGYSA